MARQTEHKRKTSNKLLEETDDFSQSPYKK